MKRFKERALAASKPLPPPAPVGWEQDLGRETSSSRSSIRPEVKRLGPESENEVFSREFAYLLSQETKKGLYQPLDFDTFEIRLLRVHRDPKHFTLVCSLEYASLINPPEYTALSYRWGDASNMKGCVNIEGWGEIKITHSLERALLGLRQLDYTNDPHGNRFEGKLLWVDAVCINQQDLVERSQQVRQMRQIYSRAKEVICWVDYGQGEAVEYLIKNHFYGQACETTDRVSTPAFDADRLRRYEISESDSDEYDGDYGKVNALRLERARSQLEKFEHEQRKGWVARGWKILEGFFRDEYWRRVWVIQEVAVATDVKIVVGESVIPWEDVAAVWARWTNEPESVPLETRSYLNATHLAEFRYRFQVKREPISLLDAMRWTYQAEATDPRDKIFALLGLCHDGPNYVPVPNYKQPLEEIIADMSKGMMSFDRSLDLMCFKGTSLAEESKLPSWTPNWVNLWSGSLHSMTVHEAAYTDWHTTFSFNPILYGSTTQTLKVEGIFHGHITRLASEFAKPDPDGNLILKIEHRAPWISSASALIKTNPFETLDSDHRAIKLRNSIWKTLTMGLLPPEMNDSDAALCFSKLWRPEGRGTVHNLALIEWLDRNAWFEWRINGKLTRSLRSWSQIGRSFTPQPTISAPRGAGSKNPFKSLNVELKSTQTQTQGEHHAARMLDTFIETLDNVLGSGMRFATIWSGKWHIMDVGEQLVLAPPATEESDHVWFVKGCSVPLVLREVTEVKDEVRTVKYKVIGGLYVCDFLKQHDEAEEKWTRGEEVEGLKSLSTVLNLC